MKCLSWTMLAALMAVSAPRSARADEAKAETAPATEVAPDLNFDDLIPTTPTTTPDPKVPLAPPVDESVIKARRTMLTIHQVTGIALSLGMVGSMVSGQLNYNDKFLNKELRNSGRYELLHQSFVYPTVGLAAVTAGLGIFAPVPIEKKSHGFDRMTLHKIGQFTALAGWAAQAGLGLYASSREGFVNQQAFATAHLAVGYVTLAAVLLGLGAIVF